MDWTQIVRRFGDRRVARAEGRPKRSSPGQTRWHRACGSVRHQSALIGLAKGAAMSIRRWLVLGVVVCLLAFVLEGQARQQSTTRAAIAGIVIDYEIVPA